MATIMRSNIEKNTEQNRLSIIDHFYFNRAVDINAPKESLQTSILDVIEQVHSFDIDRVYFSQDDNKSFPAVFLKRVDTFNDSTLKNIAIIHKKAWNYKKVSFLYVYSETEIRIYNCITTPVCYTSEPSFFTSLKDRELVTCQQTDTKKLMDVVRMFSSIAIDSGLIWSLEEAKKIRENINWQYRVDHFLVKSLTKTSEMLRREGLTIELIHRLILRSLFLLYLEDRGSTSNGFYATIKKDATSYLDILHDVDATYRLYDIIEKQFNGNVFSILDNEKESIQNTHLELIRTCFISGHEPTLFTEERLFNFSIIQIELLSQIYENFLINLKEKDKKETGTYYTPPSLVELILNEKLPTNSKEYNIKVLDPACGSGIFLVESFNRVVKRYEKSHNNKKLTDFNILKQLLLNSIFGIENDIDAIKVATFSLYLSLMDKVDPKTIWQNNQLPYLINDPTDETIKVQGNNLFRRDTISSTAEIENINFDLVVGNPPFGSTKQQKSIKNYCIKHKFGQDMVIPFLHKAITLAPKGEIALIFNTKILTNTGKPFQRFRKWLMQECYVEKVYNFSILRKAPQNFGGQLFGDATGPISIVFYQKNIPLIPSNRILYYSPKTFIKSNVFEGIVIDSTDVQYLPREECNKPDTKIWKIAMWGGMADFEFIKYIDLKYKKNKDIFNKMTDSWTYATGLHLDSKKTDFIPERVIDTKQIDRYYTNESLSRNNYQDYRKLSGQYFNPPFILVRQTLNRGQHVISYLDYKAYCYNSAYVITGANIDDSIKKVLVAILNSKFCKYYLFMTASSWGVERDRIQANEVLLLPHLLDCIEEHTFKKINLLMDEMIKIKKDNRVFEGNAIKEIEESIDLILFNNILGLSDTDKTIIQDLLDFSLDLFEKQQHSNAVSPVSNVTPYAEKISSEMNNFLDGKELFANTTIYRVDNFCPLYLVKLTFSKDKKPIVMSTEKVSDVLRKLDKELWEEKSSNIYLRKKMNHYNGNDIFIIRPNQRRFFSISMALQDMQDLILEIMTSMK